jgi:hypothetical protein
VELQFQHMQRRPPFDDEGKRRELLRRLNEIPGIDLPDDAITRRPSISLSILAKPQVLGKFLETLDWFTEEVKAT